MNNGEDWSKDDLLAAERVLGRTFRDKKLLVNCFTHKSYSNIHGGEDNERLEFLGDSVLQLCVTEALYLRRGDDEGKLTRLRQRYVSQEALEEAARRANLMRFLRYSGREENIAGKTASNLFEAVVAGLYLDGGMSAVRPFLKMYLEEADTTDYKSKLQETVQRREKRTPEYNVVEADGKYRCFVNALGKSACGEGESKKEAEVAAARALLQILEK